MDRRRMLAVLGVLAMTASLWIAPPAVAQGTADGFIQVIKEDDQPSNAELAARLSEETPHTNPQRVIISRDDAFPDALASGLLQAEAPLLMVPRDGEIPARVTAEIARLDVSTAVILGGRAAVSDAVEAQLRALGLAIERRQGSTRIDTAVEIARTDAPDADTVILVRADGSDPANPTQAFADALPAGAMSARNRWPILLTATGTLSPQTRDYLAASSVTRVLIMGGTAAVSPQVEEEVRALVGSTERIAGASRFETAVEAAKLTDGDSAADVDRVVLVDGTSPNGFAGGFAAAGHAAAFDAPIVLTDGIMVPETTRAFLEPAATFAQAGDPVQVTCVVHAIACDISREELGLIDIPILDVTPSINSLVQPGQQVEVRLSPQHEGAHMPVSVKGSCVDGQQDLVTGADGTVTFALAGVLPPTSVCDVEITYGSGEESVNQGYSYALVPEAARGSGVSISSEIFSYGAATPSTPLYVADRIECTGPSGTVSSEDATYEAKWVYPDFYVASFSLSSFPLEAHPGDACTATAQIPQGVTGSMWGVYSWADSGLRNPLVLGRGTTASFSFDDIGSVTDVNVVWILETHSPDVTVPASPAEGVQGQVFNPEGLQVTCDGVDVGRGLSFQPPGASCTVGGAPAGSAVLVVEPGRPVRPEPTATFTASTSGFTTAVYPIFVDTASVGGGQGGAAGCVGAAELPYATITQGLTTPNVPAAYYTFPAFAGEDLRFRADALGAGGDGSLDPLINLYASDGSLVGTNDDDPLGSSLNSRLDVTIPQDDDYCLEVTGYSGTGEFVVTADPAANVYSEADFLDETYPAAEYPVYLTEGSLLVVEMRVADFDVTDPLLALVDSAGEIVTFDDDGGGYPNARLEFVAPATDEYTIVTTVYEDFFGAYTMEASVLLADGAQAFAARR